MTITENEVLSFVKENDVKFIWLSFCDLFGTQKSISIMAGELASAFENGVSFDAHAIRGFKDVTRSDLFLFPDPATLTVLPWRPGPGRVVRFYCDVRNPDGSLYAHDSRYILKQAVARCDRMGYVCKVGPECEFYLFKTDENGDPTEMPIDRGGYLDISPLDRCGNIRREICLTLEEMGLNPETSHHEQGPGQNEIDFRFGDALSGADNLQTLKTVVREIAARNGCFASFMPKPIPENPGSGMHVNLSLAKNGLNIFRNSIEGHSGIAESFIAGILERISEMTIFLNPLANSYERFGRYEAPGYISWSHQNRSQLIRIPAASGEKVRMELRSPDPAMNPYLAFAMIINAGLDGIEKDLALPPAVDADLYTAGDEVLRELSPLPRNMEDAIFLAEGSGFVRSVVGEELLVKYISAKKAECVDYTASGDKQAFYRKRYFYTV